MAGAPGSSGTAYQGGRKTSPRPDAESGNGSISPVWQLMRDHTGGANVSGGALRVRAARRGFGADVLHGEEQL